MPTPKQELEALLDRLAPEIRDAFLLAIQDVVDNVILADVAAAVERGDVEGAFRALGMSDAALRPMTAAIERAYEAGGIATGATFPKRLNTASGRVVFRFDVRNSRAEKWLRERSSELITRLTDETRVNVRNVLTIGMQEGRNPRSVALDIVGRVNLATGRREGGIVGLSNQQERWVANTRRDLQSSASHLRENYFSRELRDKRFDSVVRRAIDEGKALPSETVERLVGRYKDNALRWRGESIGRTEAMQGLNASEYEATRQAVDMGAAQASDVQRIWDSASDRRVRHTHRSMDGQKKGLTEPFVSPSGARMMHPGDTSLGAGGDETIQCRCRVRTRIDWLAGIGRES